MGGAYGDCAVEIDANLKSHFQYSTDYPGLHRLQSSVVPRPLEGNKVRGRVALGRVRNMVPSPGLLRGRGRASRCI